MTRTDTGPLQAVKPPHKYEPMKPSTQKELGIFLIERDYQVEVTKFAGRYVVRVGGTLKSNELAELLAVAKTYECELTIESGYGVVLG